MDGAGRPASRRAAKNRRLRRPVVAPGGREPARRRDRARLGAAGAYDPPDRGHEPARRLDKRAPRRPAAPLEWSAPARRAAMKNQPNPTPYRADGTILRRRPFFAGEEAPTAAGSRLFLQAIGSGRRAVCCGDGSFGRRGNRAVFRSEVTIWAMTKIQAFTRARQGERQPDLGRRKSEVGTLDFRLRGWKAF